MGEKIITVPELAKRLGRSIPYVQALIRTKKIPGRKTAAGWVTTQAAVENYLNKYAQSKSRPK